MSVDAVVKLGGSLLGTASLSPLLATLSRLAESRRLVVVPGGGPFADAVRHACERHDPGRSAAHWMAILGMEQHAQLLAGLLPTARLAQDLVGIERALADKRLCLLAPHAWLRAADPLPHGWHVTSDSIAAWVAARLAAARLVLLKSVEGVLDGDGRLAPELDAAAASQAGVVDPHFLRELEPGRECWILSGRHPDRLEELLRTGRTRGTRVRG